MARHRLFIDKNGNVIALYNDSLGAAADKLGSKEIKRASNVEFNNSTNCWEVRLPSGEMIAQAFSREAAIEAEIDWLETRYRADLYEGKVLVHRDCGCASGEQAVQPS